MIKSFLQFIKKQKFANDLAKYDCLFLLNDVAIFNLEKKLAKAFLKTNNLTPRQKVIKYLQSKNNPLLYAIAQEVSSMPRYYNGDVFYINRDFNVSLKGDVLYKDAENIKDSDFYLSLFHEFIYDECNCRTEEVNFMKHRLDLLTDSRFYGSELEKIHDLASNYEQCCDFDVDWIKTNQLELYLSFNKTCVLTQVLNKKTQENMIDLCGYLLFEKGVFISYFDTLLVNEKDHVCFIDFDYVYEASEEDKAYALDFLSKDIKPVGYQQEKLSRGIKLIKEFCPDVDLEKKWSKYRSMINLPKQKQDFVKANFLSLFQKSPVLMVAPPKSEETKPEDVAYLLDTDRHKKDPQFAKSSAKYWIPLLILIFLLLKYF